LGALSVAALLIDPMMIIASFQVCMMTTSERWVDGWMDGCTLFNSSSQGAVRSNQETLIDRLIDRSVGAFPQFIPPILCTLRVMGKTTPSRTEDHVVNGLVVSVKQAFKGLSLLTCINRRYSSFT
jgi:hypothetical protein